MSDLYERIEELGRQRGYKNITVLCSAAGVPRSTMTELKQGRSKILSLMTAQKFAEKLGVSVDSLLGSDATMIKDAFHEYEHNLRDEDARILHAYHSADQKTRDIVEFVLNYEVAPVVELRSIPLLATAAAAGPGEPDTELPWESYDVPATSPAEFAVRVSGDSMAPVLADGQIALCAKQRPSIGDLAVIMVNGSLLVKQYIRDNYGNVYLRSLNRKRKNCDYDLLTSGNDTAMYYGKVILDKKIPLVDE